MGRAIGIAFLVVVLAYGFVFFQLTRRRASEPASLTGAPVLITRDDGSIYSVGLRLERMEQRLMDEENRSLRLTQEVRDLEQQRDTLRTQVGELQEDLRRIKEQSAPLPPPEGGTPGGEPLVPGTPVPPTGGEGTTPPIMP